MTSTDDLALVHSGLIDLQIMAAIVPIGEHDPFAGHAIDRVRMPGAAEVAADDLPASP